MSLVRIRTHTSVPSIRKLVLAQQASHIPAFFVAFCVTPFASNASELVSSLRFAMRKRKKNISLTYSQVWALACPSQNAEWEEADCQRAWAQKSIAAKEQCMLGKQKD